MGWPPPRTRYRPPLKPGECLEIPLPDGRHAYGQYIGLGMPLGVLVRVFDAIGVDPIPLQSLEGAPLLFPPVFVAGFDRAIRSKAWRRAGALPLEDMPHPLFRSLPMAILKPGTYDNWSIWDGENKHFVGKLTGEQRKLEFLWACHYETVAERIATGVDCADKYR